MSKDGVACTDGKLKPFRAWVGGADSDLAKELGKAYKAGQVEFHSVASQAAGRAKYEWLDSFRVTNAAINGGLRLIDQTFNTVDKATGREFGWNPTQLLHHFSEADKVLRKATIDPDATDITQRVRAFTEAFTADKKNANADVVAFGDAIRPLLRKEVGEFNKLFKTNIAAELLKERQYETMADALMEVLPKKYRNYATANEIIAVKNYLDTYAAYWEKGGDLFQSSSRNPVAKLVNTITGVIISTDPAISIYNFLEMQKGFAWAVRETGSFSGGMKLYAGAFKKLLGKEVGLKLFDENADFASEYKTLYSKHQGLPRPNNVLGKAMSKYEDALGKSDTMLRTFYYQLGKDLAEVKGEGADGIALGKQSVADNIFIYDVGNKPMFLSGDFGTLAYSMMRFAVGQSLQNISYLKAAWTTKDPTAFKALATQMATFYAMFGVQGTLGTIGIAAIGEATMGKDEWRKMARELDDTLPFLDLNDKLLSTVSGWVGGGDVNTSYRTSPISSPYLGVGLSRLNALYKGLQSGSKNVAKAVAAEDYGAAALLSSDMLMSVLLASPAFGSGANADIIKSMRKSMLGTPYEPNSGKFDYELLLEELQISLLGSEGS